MKRKIMMRKTILTVILTGISLSINSQNTFPSSGNVGIGTLNPQWGKLQINSSSVTENALRLEIGRFSMGGRAEFQIDKPGTHGGRLIVKENGNVGIGTTNTKGYRLGVKGKIAAEEVKVAVYNGWSDFVFEKNYNLPTLKEVENHIEENGHLKDIPSAKEVQENGIFLGEMDSKLLQKIEELTLYTIQQEKKITEQADEIKELKNLNTKLLELQSRLEKLESEK